MRAGLLALSTWLAATSASNDVDARDLMVQGFADPEECYGALEAADSSTSDEIITPDEYALFVKELGPPGFLAHCLC